MVGLCDNRNSPITIMLVIITIITIVQHMHKIPQNIIKYSSLCCSLLCYPVPSRYAICYQYNVKMPTLVTNYQRKHLYSESIYFTTIDTYHDTEKIIFANTIIFVTVIYHIFSDCHTALCDGADYHLL